MLLVGTSGFKYRDWKGVFYPPGISERNLLAFYSQVFPVVELDFSYYHMPGAKTMGALQGKTPDGFVFCVKAHRSMTHETGSASAQWEAFRAFNSAIEPMAISGKLGCVLLQFPWRFRPGHLETSYLARCRDLLGNAPAVVEFRNSQWLTEDTFRALRDLGFGFCCVDEPRLKDLVPPVVAATSAVGYVRFHGRNAAKWWKHENASERYDYLYCDEELRAWVPRLRALERKTGTTFVFFNNCHEGKASVNAIRLGEMLRGREGEIL
ncbi:MAG: DUF72 domain-containing protein [Bacillota bacterium]